MLLVFFVFPIISGLLGCICEYVVTRLSQKKYLSFLKCFRSCAYWIALLGLLATLTFLVYTSVELSTIDDIHSWSQTINMPWIPMNGIRFHLFLNSSSLVICLLITLISLIALLYSHRERRQHASFFYLSLLSMSSISMMLCSAQDLFLFFFLWELITVPFYFLMILWGRHNRSLNIRFVGASKFIIYTQISSLLMLMAILILVLTNLELTGGWSFDITLLSQTLISIYTEITLCLFFFLAFIIRLPLFPFHTWFIEAHRDSSTTSSIMLSGIFCSSILYCFVQFIFPLFPNAMIILEPWIMGLALFSLFLNAFICFKQNDIKQLIAYSHLSFIGLMVCIICCNSLLAFQGAFIILIGVSLTITGLFILSSLLVDIYATRNINRLGLLRSPKKGSVLTLLFILMIAGLPGSANFTGMLMVTIGNFSQYPYFIISLILGILILAVAFILRIQPLFYGDAQEEETFSTLKNKPSMTMQGLLILILLSLFAIGLNPGWIIDMTTPWLSQLEQVITTAELNRIQGGL